MKRFKVHISEILGREVFVEAENIGEAYNIVYELCNSDIIYLNDKDFGDRNIEIICESDDNIKYDKIYTKKDLFNEKE